MGNKLLSSADVNLRYSEVQLNETISVTLTLSLERVYRRVRSRLNFREKKRGFIFLLATGSTGTETEWNVRPNGIIHRWIQPYVSRLFEKGGCLLSIETWRSDRGIQPLPQHRFQVRISVHKLESKPPSFSELLHSKSSSKERPNKTPPSRNTLMDDFLYSLNKFGPINKKIIEPITKIKRLLSSIWMFQRDWQPLEQYSFFCCLGHFAGLFSHNRRNRVRFFRSRGEMSEGRKKVWSARKLLFAYIGPTTRCVN